MSLGMSFKGGHFLMGGTLHLFKKTGVADFRYEFFLKGARRAPFKKNSYPDPPMPKKTYLQHCHVSYAAR